MEASSAGGRRESLARASFLTLIKETHAMSFFKNLFSATPPPPRLVLRNYLSQDAQHIFAFRFQPDGDHINIYCLRHPPLNGQDPSPHKTHLFDSGKVCFIAGKEPRNQARAEQLAKQWAEYYLEYSRTGVAQQ
jgi:hypothetical protein